MSARLVYTGEAEWFWQRPNYSRRGQSASSKKGRNNQKRRQRLRQEVLERDGYLCTYCPESATVADHLIPLAKGGVDEVENMTAACEPCNQTLGWLGL